MALQLFACIASFAACCATAGVSDSEIWKKAERLTDEASNAMTRGDLSIATKKFLQACKLRRAVTLEADTPKEHPLLVAREDGGFRRLGRMKLRHDAEQLEYLVHVGRLPAKPYASYAAFYRKVIPKLPDKHPAVDLDGGVHKLLDRLPNRAVHLTSPGTLPAGVISKSFDVESLNKRFRSSELAPEASGCEAQNGIAFADGLLSPEALTALHEWCLESTMWFHTRAGYLASFMQEAFNAPIIVQLAEELRQALPDILGDHQLMNMWAFKYSNNASDWPLEGTAVHADVAAVNVNLWITNDQANEDPEGGGLVVYTKQAPKDWGFADYNSLDQVPKIKEYLQDSDRVVVPHRQNRVVLFNSNLFHETQKPRFRPGYANRRINLTLLFGRRCAGAGGTNEGRASRKQSSSGKGASRSKVSLQDRLNFERSEKDEL